MQPRKVASSVLDLTLTDWSHKIFAISDHQLRVTNSYRLHCHSSAFDPTPCVVQAQHGNLAARAVAI